MLHLLAILAVTTTSTGETDATEPERNEATSDATAEVLTIVEHEAPDLLTPPPAPVLDLTGLGRQYATPSEAKCFAGNGDYLGDGFWVPAALAEAQFKHNLAWDVYPKKVKARFDELVPHVVDAAIDVVATKPAPGHSTLTLLGWTVGSAAVAAIVGGFVGYNLAK